MGYMKIYCVWNSWEILRFGNRLLFFLNPHSQVIFFLLVEAVNELRMEKTKIGILLNSIFNSQVYNYFVVENILPKIGKSYLLHRMV